MTSLTITVPLSISCNQNDWCVQ